MSMMVSVSGIRGIVGEDITPLSIISYITAFVRVLEKRHEKGKPSGKILIGRDTRASGIYIEKIVEGTLSALGYDTVKLGIAATPTVLLAVRKLGCLAGIAITASHNPTQWNALKLCDRHGLFFTEDKIRKMQEHVGGQYLLHTHWKKFNETGTAAVDACGTSIHIEHVLKFIDRDLIKSQNFKVAIDPAGGTGAVIDREFLEELGCSVTGVNDEPAGLFPREPEPVPENLADLCILVKNEGADIGFAQDPDGDRLAVVSELGEPLGEEYTLVLAGEAYLRKKKTDIVCNLSTSMMCDKLGERFGVRVIRTKVGEINVTTTLLEKGLLFGGEGNGGVIVPEINPCRDSIVAMALILELLANKKQSISNIIRALPSYFMKKEKVSVSERNTKRFYPAISAQIKEHFPQHLYTTLDGIKIYCNSEWLHIRLSNTEPAVRIMAESETTERTDKLIKFGKQLIEENFSMKKKAK